MAMTDQIAIAQEDGRSGNAFLDAECARKQHNLDAARSRGDRTVNVNERLVEDCKAQQAHVVAVAKERDGRRNIPAPVNRDRRIDTLRADPAAMRIGWSATICEAALTKSESRAIIEHGGDKHAEHEEGLHAVDNDKTARAQLRALHVAPVPCSDPLVERVAKCVGRICADGDARDYASALPARTIRARGDAEKMPPTSPENKNGLPPWRVQ